IFITKLNAAGILIWAKQMGAGTGIGSGFGYSIAVDTLGNVYTTGYFTDTVDFDPGTGSYYLHSSAATFISKLDAAGNFVWAKQMGDGTGIDAGLSSSVDGSGNVYTSAHFSVTVDFDLGVGSFNLSSAGCADIFVSKLDAAGNFVWPKQIGGANDDIGL